MFTHQMQKMKDIIGHNMRKNYYLPAMYELGLLGSKIHAMYMYVCENKF